VCNVFSCAQSFKISHQELLFAIVLFIDPERIIKMFHNFFQAIAWNVFNVFLYKIILQTHTSCLFLVTSRELFGISGTLFSTIYFLISVTNIGFDYFIITHHNSYTQSRQHFKKLFYLFIVRILMLGLFLWIAYIGMHYGAHYKPIQFLLHSAPPLLLLIVTTIFVTENLKKSLDVVAQMAFLQKTITIFDISTLLLYLTLVWSAYFIQGSMTLYTIFIPMSIISIIECMLLTQRIYRYYQSMPLHAPDQSYVVPSRTTVIMQQATNYVNQITKALFSPNFFIIVLAYHLGVSKAGYIKLFTDIIILLYMLLNRSFGLPSAALFASITQKNPNDPQLIKNTFLTITNWYIQFLYALGFTLLAIMVSCLSMQTCMSSAITFNIALFVFAGFIEYIMISYEKWYLTQNAAFMLATINALSLIPYSFLLYYTSAMPPSFMLTPLIFLRLYTIIIVIYMTYRTWNIKPTWSIHTNTIIATLVSVGIISCWHCLY